MTAPEDWLRPSAAAARFGVDESTVGKWARTGLIGHTRVGRALWVSASDIEALRTANAVPRRVIREVKDGVEMPVVGADWREHELFRRAR
jgi:hypothetical protein